LFCYATRMWADAHRDGRPRNIGLGSAACWKWGGAKVP